MAKDLYVKASLHGGTITAPAVLSGPLQTQARLGQTVKEYVHDPDYEGPYTVTPSEQAQTLETEGMSMTDDVAVEAIPDSYVGSGVSVRGLEDLTVEGAMVWTPAGYYPGKVGKTVAVARDLPNPTITVDSDGLITATETIFSGAYYDAGRTNSRTKQLTRQAGKTVTPTEEEQTAVTAGKFTTGDVKVGPIPYTKHQIYFGLADETDVTIPVYCSDAVLTEMITGYTPTTYGGKEVVLAQLDGVTWYQKPSATYQTIFNEIISINANPPAEGGGYAWISQLSSYAITDGSLWRITYKGVEYYCTAYYDAELSPTYGYVIGGDQASGMSEILMAPSGWGAWVLNTSETSGEYRLKVEQGTVA